MKRILKIVGGLFCTVVVIMLGLGWWYLGRDTIEEPELPGTMEIKSIEHNDHKRSWISYIPANKIDQPALVIVLHGSRGDAEGAIKLFSYGFNILAEKHGFIAVYPNGYDRHWNDCRGGASYEANRQNIDDIGFLRKLVAEMEKAYEIDRTKVFVTGVSNGGQMAFRTGFEAPDLVTAVAAIAANLPIKENFDCQRTNKPVAMLIMNGTADPLNPYEGGLVKILGDISRGIVMSANKSAAYWANIAGHAITGQTIVWPDRDPEDGTIIKSTSWSKPGKKPVKLITVSGGGHTIPHTVSRLPRIVGLTSHEFDAAEVIWDFFKEAGKLSRTSTM
jgi:polyhydroxybutyrate depolymerase